MKIIETYFQKPLHHQSFIFNKLMLLAIIFSFFFSSQISAQIQNPEKDTVIELRKFSEEKIQEFKNNKDFIYKEPEVDKESFFDRLIWWILDKIFSLFSNEGASPYIRYALIFALIVTVVLVIMRTRLSRLFRSDIELNKKTDIITDGDIHSINFDEEIHKNINSGSYRIATRLLYLKLLKLLSDKKIIKWAPEKTNSDYYQQISDKKFSGEFLSLSFSYEYVWYGNFTIHENSFNLLNKKFEDFFENIMQNK